MAAAGNLPGWAARGLLDQLKCKRLLRSSLPNASPSQITPKAHRSARAVFLVALELVGFLTFLFKKSKNWPQKRASFASCQAVEQTPAAVRRLPTSHARPLRGGCLHHPNTRPRKTFSGKAGDLHVTHEHPGSHQRQQPLSAPMGIAPAFAGGKEMGRSVLAASFSRVV